MGVRSAAVMLVLTISLSTPLRSLCYSSPYSFPAIKSTCVDYISSLWSLVHHSAEQQQHHILSSRNLFLLVNVIIFVLLINLHLQQHAARASGGKKAPKRKKHPRGESMIANYEKEAASSQVSSLANDDIGPAEAAAMAEQALCASEVAAELDSEEFMEASDDVQLECSTVGPEAGQIILEKDGRLRLIGGLIAPPVGTGKTKGRDAESRENGRLGSIESGNSPDAEEEKGVEPVKGDSDAEEIVPEEVGRLRLIGRPPSNKPLKSHSTGDKHVDEPSEGSHNSNNPLSPNDFTHDSQTRSLSHSNYDIYAQSLNNQPNSPDNTDSSITALNNGTLVIDLSASPPIKQSPKKEGAPPPHSSSKSKSSSLKRTSSRPMRGKKSESLDATWKAISSNKGSAASSSKDHKHLIRQSSRQDFKPGGRGRLSNNKLVRREPSIGQEELNAKVESFIAKFNEQIRIQRQQSILSYMQMVDRGA